jgi:thiaminase/transcriptional activator TenA
MRQTEVAARRLLPCWHAGSRHPLYQRFIDRFGGSEYEELTMQVVAMVNNAAAELGDAQRQLMRRIFVHGCRMEWMFFEGCFRRQEWPV